MLVVSTSTNHFVKPLFCITASHKCSRYFILFIIIFYYVFQAMKGKREVKVAKLLYSRFPVPLGQLTSVIRGKSEVNGRETSSLRPRHPKRFGHAE